MFHINISDIETIFKDYNIISKIRQVSELQRYDKPASKEVRLVVKVDLENAPSVVIRLKNESDVTVKQTESQSVFQDILRKNGVITPYSHKCGGCFARQYNIRNVDVRGGYDVIVTVEQFAENEIKTVDTLTAEKTGALLAKMHTVSENNRIHINNKVLFNPFEKNELFDFKTFKSLKAAFKDEDKVLFDKIVNKYNAYMEILSPLKKQPRYAVQGDISNCNLYLTPFGEVGVFDFNRCGDNNLFCDAVMQAVFEARLMDYPENKPDDFDREILTSFLKGYSAVRSFSKEEQSLYPYLYAVIDAFWSADIRWNKDSLLNAHKNADAQSVRNRLQTIWQRLTLPE